MSHGVSGIILISQSGAQVENTDDAYSMQVQKSIIHLK